MLDGDLTNSENTARVRVVQLIQLTKGYSIRRDLNNKVIDVLQAMLAYEALVFLSRKKLCEAVSRHLSSGFPLDSDPSSFHLLAAPHLMDINVTKLGLDSISVASYQTYSLSVVTPESLLGMKRKADVAAEAIPVLRFNASSQESVQLCFSGRTSD
jgi:hypothetical protein